MTKEKHKLSELDDLIIAYAQNKERLDNFDKLCKEENAVIKSIMIDYAVPQHSAGDYTASCSVSTRETMNEEKLLDIAHRYKLSHIIKTKEYIDFDALEYSIYNNQIPEKILLEMDKAKEVKKVTTLRVKKKKKEKK